MLTDLEAEQLHEQRLGDEACLLGMAIQPGCAKSVVGASPVDWRQMDRGKIDALDCMVGQVVLPCLERPPQRVVNRIGPASMSTVTTGDEEQGGGTILDEISD